MTRNSDPLGNPWDMEKIKEFGQGLAEQHRLKLFGKYLQCFG